MLSSVSELPELAELLAYLQSATWAFSDYETRLVSHIGVDTGVASSARSKVLHAFADCRIHRVGIQCGISSRFSGTVTGAGSMSDNSRSSAK